MIRRKKMKMKHLIDINNSWRNLNLKFQPMSLIQNHVPLVMIQVPGLPGWRPRSTRRKPGGWRS